MSLLSLELCGRLEGIDTIKELCDEIRDASKGASLRRYAGLEGKRLPTGDDFTHLHQRLGEEGYQDILHGFVEMFSRIGLITGRIRTHDGTLFPTRANYRGCAYFCDACESLYVSKLMPRIQQKLKETKAVRNAESGMRNKPIFLRTPHSKLRTPLAHAASELGNEKRVSVLCSSESVPEGKKRPRIPVLRFKLHVLRFKLHHQDNYTISEETQRLVKLFGVESLLQVHHVSMQVLSFPVEALELRGATLESATLRCPRIPADTDAKCGFRRSKTHPGKTEMVFGFDTVTTLSIEPQLGLELPIACSTAPGDCFEGHQLPLNLEQLQRWHPQLKARLDIADSGYDAIDCYNLIRNEGSSPLIDYNRRNEKLTQEALIARGYNAKGTPLTDCSLALPLSHNGYDAIAQRHAYCCRKVCRGQNPECPYLNNKLGYCQHMSIKEHPRLVLEIPRESKRFQQLYHFRSASEDDLPEHHAESVKRGSDLNRGT